MPSSTRSSSKKSITLTPLNKDDESKPFADESTAAADSQNSSGISSFFSYSRVSVEKELQNLNGRLANYIDRIRSQRYNFEGTIPFDVIDEKLDEVRVQFQRELDKNHRILLQAEEEGNKLKFKYENMTKVSKNFEEKLIVKERKIKELLGEIENLNRSRNKLSETIEKMSAEIVIEKEKTVELHEENENLLKDNSEIRELLEIESMNIIKIKKELESEKSLRTLDRDLFRKCEIEFKDRIEVLEYQLKEKNEECEKLDKSIFLKLEELRVEFENEVHLVRTSLTSLYENKLILIDKELETKKSNLKDALANLNSVKDLNQTLTQRNDELEIELRKIKRILEKSASTSEREIRDLKKELAQKGEHIDDLLSKINLLSDEYKITLQEKLISDTEIDTYRKLLEGEEKRLKIDSRNKSTKRRSSLAFRDSTLHINSQTSSSPVTFSDWSVDDHYLTLKNVSEIDFDLSSHFIGLQKDDSTHRTFLFDDDIKLEPGKTITIYSAGASIKSNRANELIAGDINSFFFNTENEVITDKICLFSPLSEVVAQLDLKLGSGESSLSKYSKKRLKIARSRNNGCIIS